MEDAFFVRLAIELLIAGLQAADKAGFQLFVSASTIQFPIPGRPRDEVSLPIIVGAGD